MLDANDYPLDPEMLEALERGEVVEIKLDGDLDDTAIAAIVEKLAAAAHSRGLKQATEIISYDDDRPWRTRQLPGDLVKTTDPPPLRLTGERLA